MKDDSKIKKILYVEDNPLNMLLVTEIIEMTPHHLIPAVTGLAGIEAALKHQPDLILLDINLPDLNGIEVLKRLQKDPSVSQIPVVAVSANAMKSDIDMALEAGFKQYITKPINVEYFLATIESLFKPEETYRD